jgi:hypothetical protein
MSASLLDFLSQPQRWVIPAVLLVSVAGVLLNLWWERRRPSSYTRRMARLAELAEWRAKSTAEQEAVDEAALDAAEQAEIDARMEASEAAADLLERRARINVQYHP